MSQRLGSLARVGGSSGLRINFWWHGFVQTLARHDFLSLKLISRLPNPVLVKKVVPKSCTQSQISLVPPNIRPRVGFGRIRLLWMRFGRITSGKFVVLY